MARKLTLRSSGGRGRLHNKLLKAFSISVKVRNLLVKCFDDDDISEDEFLLLYDGNTSKNPDFPYDCYGSFDLNDMDSSECLAEFRFHKNDVPVLLEALQLPQSFTCHQGTICDGIEALCITLRRLAYPCRCSDLIPWFGRSVPELSTISNLVMDTIYEEHHHRGIICL